MAGVGDTEKWYQAYKDRANFLMVYIEEAHPGTLVDGLQVFAHESYEDRQELAELCTASKNLTLPTVLDKLDNAVEIAYAAFPDRIYVLDSDGIVRHKTKPGPRGWDVSGPRKALDHLLSK
jgi:hypothetical protein